MLGLDSGMMLFIKAYSGMNSVKNDFACSYTHLGRGSVFVGGLHFLTTSFDFNGYLLGCIDI